MGRLSVVAPDGIGEVTEGTDLAALVAEVADLRDGDVVVVTGKVVSKAEGRTVVVGTGPASDAAYETHLAGETLRLVARRGRTRIVRNRLGLVMAAAGIDRSNVATDALVLLPLDPDASARTMRARLHDLVGVNVGVVVTDTAGRAWREGQTDIAIGLAGVQPAEAFAGRHDSYGNPLAVTLPAVADEIAGAAELAQGKLGARPVAVLRGRADLVLPVGDDGPGARALQRPEGADLFGFGAREAVVVALADEPHLRPVFGAPADLVELADAFDRVVPGSELRTDDGEGDEGAELTLPRPVPVVVVRALCIAHGWRLDGQPGHGAVTSAHLSPSAS
ncbi:coenzyme F420-0:L-glutamate ligase [Nocardioides sp. Y6]|uniref:Coenzyme F420-0:L-glutamate ligase n=1 Tax=Nocardioides malaquae TaxID=2773426 RepID=A0ABR9RPE6_9ACTN|nr:coenzyme F420-0:L-glutamate ligase [Nocardioides malaquae]MBE7323451.1 coenzyme F420-0:L-glutamate ligase [Nocardioides malaquae]